MSKTSKIIIQVTLFISILMCGTAVMADQFDSFFDEEPFTADTAEVSFTAEAPYVQNEVYARNDNSSIQVLPKGADIFDAAIDSYSSVSQKDVELSLAKAKMRSAKQEYNALVTWDVDAGFVHTKATDHSLSKTIHNNDRILKTSVSLKKTLWDKALNYSVEASKLNIQTAKINQFGEQQALIESVALAYLEYLSAKDMEATAQRRTNMFSQLTTQIHRKEKLGYAADIDVVEVEKQLQTAHIALLSAQTNLQKTQINLHQITDSDMRQISSSRSFFKWKNDVSLKPVSYLIDTALINNTELKSLRSDQLSLRKVIQVKRAEKSPKLNLVSSLSQAWKRGDADQDSFDFSLGMNMKMPLYTGGRIDNQVKQAKLGLLQTERGSNKKRREIITQLNILSTEFSGALSSYKSLLKLRKHLAKNIKLTKAAVPFGVRGNRHIYSALDDQFQLQNSLVKQYYDLLKIKVKIMKITGDLDSKNLNQLRGLLLSRHLNR